MISDCNCFIYRDTIAAGNISDCHLCPAGNRCPNESMTYSGIQCDEGYHCPDGAQIQVLCAAGYYCNFSMAQVPCPPGYYCPNGTAYPIPCPQGHYCGKLDSCNVSDAGKVLSLA